jgi:hypothetical protein
MWKNWKSASLPVLPANKAMKVSPATRAMVNKAMKASQAIRAAVNIILDSRFRASRQLFGCAGVANTLPLSGRHRNLPFNGST